MRVCVCVCVTSGGLRCIILHISYQGQLGQWQGMEQKASQGTACDLRPYAADGTEHTHTQIETRAYSHLYTHLHR